MVEQIREARDDSSIKAIVLRVDSPGGSSVASDVIWRELMMTREDDDDRPLVVSMSDLAASGGYYIAMAGDSIVAQPGTHHRVDWRLRRQDRHWRRAEQDRRQPVKRSCRVRRPASTRRLPLHAASAREAPGDHAGHLRRLRREGGGIAQDHARAASTPWRRVACGPVSRRASRVSSTRSAASTPRSRLRRSRPRFRSTRTSSSSCTPDGARSMRRCPRQLGGASLLSHFIGRDDARAIGAVTTPMRLFKRGEPLTLLPFAFVR